MSWLDDLMAQIAQNGADAVPSEPATDSTFNQARDSQSANSLFGSVFEGGDPSIDSTPPGRYETPAPPDNMPAAAADYRNGADIASDQYHAPANGGVMQALATKAGLKRDASGSIDYSDPKTIDALVKLVLGGGALMNALTHQNAPQGYKTAAQLQAEIKNPLSSWNPTQQASANAFFNTPINNGPTRARIYASDMRSPIVPGKGYASGGAITPFSSSSPSAAAYGNVPIDTSAPPPVYGLLHGMAGMTVAPPPGTTATSGGTSAPPSSSGTPAVQPGALSGEVPMTANDLTIQRALAQAALSNPIIAHPAPLGTGPGVTFVNGVDMTGAGTTFDPYTGMSIYQPLPTGNLGDTSGIDTSGGYGFTLPPDGSSPSSAMGYADGGSIDAPQTTQPVDGSSVYSAQQILDAANGILNNGGSWGDVWNTAQQNGVNLSQLSSAYGVTPEYGQNFLSQQGVQTQQPMTGGAPDMVGTDTGSGGGGMALTSPLTTQTFGPYGDQPNTSSGTNAPPYTFGGDQLTSNEGTGGAAVQTTAPPPGNGLTQQQIDAARNWISTEWGMPQGIPDSERSLYSDAFNPDGSYNTSNDNRNLAVLGAGIANGYSNDQMAAILHEQPGWITNYLHNYESQFSPNQASHDIGIAGLLNSNADYYDALAPTGGNYNPYVDPHTHFNPSAWETPYAIDQTPGGATARFNGGATHELKGSDALQTLTKLYGTPAPYTWGAKPAASPTFDLSSLGYISPQAQDLYSTYQNRVQGAYGSNPKRPDDYTNNNLIATRIMQNMLYGGPYSSGWDHLIGYNPSVSLPHMAQGGALGHVMGDSGGQDDKVDARLSGGEYVMDADTVSSVGDGNNAAGAKKLDAWREELRSQKRAAPVSKIPPKTRDLSSYMKGGR